MAEGEQISGWEFGVCPEAELAHRLPGRKERLFISLTVLVLVVSSMGVVGSVTTSHKFT